MSLSLWSRIMRRWGKKIFTKANIKSMALRGQRATSLKSIQQLAESMTDTMMDETIDISKRTKLKVIEYQVARYEACDSRAANIEMPPDWNKCGPYVIKKSKPPPSPWRIAGATLAKNHTSVRFKTIVRFATFRY